jgi:hypothetical protein
LKDKELVLNKLDEYLKVLPDYSSINKSYFYLKETIYYNTSYYKFKVDLLNDITKKDFDLVYDLIRYCRDKYIKTKNSLPKFDIDKILKLKKLDSDPDLTDGEKADLLFSPEEEIPLIPRSEDKKRKNLIRTMRKRTKKYIG